MANETMITEQEAGAAAVLVLQLFEDFLSHQVAVGAAEIGEVLHAVRGSIDKAAAAEPMLAHHIELRGREILTRLDQEQAARFG